MNNYKLIKDGRKPAYLQGDFDGISVTVRFALKDDERDERVVEDVKKALTRVYADSLGLSKSA